MALARDKYEAGGAGWEANMPRRAEELLRICYRLGTTAIKIGQACVCVSEGAGLE